MGGNTKLFAKNWKKLTSDKYILDIVTNGLRLDFKEIPFKEIDNISSEH